MYFLWKAGVINSVILNQRSQVNTNQPEELWTAASVCGPGEQDLLEIGPI